MTELLHEALRTTKTRSPWRKRCLLIGASLLLLYAFINGMLLPLEDLFVFRTVSATETWVKPPSSAVHNVKLHLADGTPIHGWWYCNSNWEPSDGAIMFCHGNSTNLSQWGERMQRWYQQLGQALLIFDYPGYGRSGGRPSEAGLYAAGDAAYDWLVKIKHVPASELLICGESLGGGVAVDVASRREHRALVLLSTFTSIPDVALHLEPWLPATMLMHNRFDSLAKIARCRGPVFIAHGTADSLVPWWQGKRLYEAAREPKCFLKLEGAGHDHRPDDKVRAQVQTFLHQAESRMALHSDSNATTN